MPDKSCPASTPSEDETRWYMASEKVGEPETQPVSQPPVDADDASYRE